MESSPRYTLPGASVRAIYLTKAAATGSLLILLPCCLPDSGVVEITTATQSAHVTVSVRDTGCGIAPATQAQLFQKYSRVSTGAAVEGSDLGLYIVRRIAEAHGGSVGVVSDVGKGSTFTLWLPY